MGVGIWELLIILMIVLLLFGAGRLPAVMKDIGKGVRSLKDGLKDDEKPVEKEKITIDKP